MSKKLFMLITGLIGVAGTAANVLLSYFDPPMATQCIAAVEIIQTAIIEALALFVVDAVKKELK